MDSAYSVEEHLEEFCEHGYELSGFTKFMEFPE